MIRIVILLLMVPERVHMAQSPSVLTDGRYASVDGSVAGNERYPANA